MGPPAAALFMTRLAQMKATAEKATLLRLMFIFVLLKISGLIKGLSSRAEMLLQAVLTLEYGFESKKAPFGLARRRICICCGTLEAVPISVGGLLLHPERNG